MAFNPTAPYGKSTNDLEIVMATDVFNINVNDVNGNPLVTKLPPDKKLVNEFPPMDPSAPPPDRLKAVTQVIKNKKLRWPRTCYTYSSKYKRFGIGCVIAIEALPNETAYYLLFVKWGHYPNTTSGDWDHLVLLPLDGYTTTGNKAGPEFSLVIKSR